MIRLESKFKGWLLIKISALLTFLLMLLLSANSVYAVCFENKGIPLTTPASDFQLMANSPSVVIHKKTGLMWRRCPLGFDYLGSGVGGACEDATSVAQEYFWDKALSASNRIEFEGYSGWRLPNIKELRSIVEYGCEPRFNFDVFPDFLEDAFASRHFWSSSPVESINAVPHAFTLSFINGTINRFGTNAVQNFVFLVRDTSTDFEKAIAPTFEHPRCQNCHAVAATNFVTGGDANGVGLPQVHPTVSASTPNSVCESCHMSNLQPPGEIDPGWHEAPLSNDLRNLSSAGLCEKATEVPGSAISAHNHLTEDRLVLWAFDPKKPFGGDFEAAPPYSVEAWRDAVDIWRDLNLPCPPP